MGCGCCSVRSARSPWTSFCRHTHPSNFLAVGGPRAQGALSCYITAVSPDIHTALSIVRNFLKRTELPPLPAIRSRSGLLISHYPTRQQIFKPIVRLFACTVPNHRTSGTSESPEKPKAGGLQHFTYRAEAAAQRQPARETFCAQAFYSSLFTEHPVSHPGQSPRLQPPVSHRAPPGTAQGERGERRSPAARGAPARPREHLPQARSACAPAAPRGRGGRGASSHEGQFRLFPPLFRGDPRLLPVLPEAPRAAGSHPACPAAPGAAACRCAAPGPAPPAWSRTSASSCPGGLRPLRPQPRAGQRRCRAGRGRAREQGGRAAPPAAGAVCAPSLGPFPPAAGGPGRAGLGCAALLVPRLGRSPAAAMRCCPAGSCPLAPLCTTHRPLLTGAGTPPPRRSSYN